MKCQWCDKGWELGRYGCHYEPLPPDWPEDEDFMRRRFDCTNWAEMRKQFYGSAPIGTRNEPIEADHPQAHKMLANG